MIDKRLPPRVNVENHVCGRQLGYLLIGVTRQYYDLKAKEPITVCPGCGKDLGTPMGRERFIVGRKVA